MPPQLAPVRIDQIELASIAEAGHCGLHARRPVAIGRAYKNDIAWRKQRVDIRVQRFHLRHFQLQSNTQLPD